MSKPTFLTAIPAFALVLLAACTLQATPQTAFQATVPATQIVAPAFTATPTLTATLPPTETPAATPTATDTPTPSESPTPQGTPPVQTLTPAVPQDAPPAAPLTPAALSATAGWSCDDFPCEDDLEGFMQRIQVPPGYRLSHVGRFPGAPMQITYGRDGALYATVLENGTRNGAVYRMTDDGTATRYSVNVVSPIGLAFQPGTDWLYVSSRMLAMQGGALWRIPPGGGQPEPVVTDLPCCFQLIENQPSGLVFGPDGYIYLTIGGLTDQGEPPPGPPAPYSETGPLEAGILRIHPHTGEVERVAAGLRNPYDVAFDSSGQFYATDIGLLSGPGDRILKIAFGAHYGWPFYRERGCDNCPPRPPALEVAPDWLPLPDRIIPRGLTVYTASQFPANMFNSLFVALWNGVEGSQRVVRIDPQQVGTGYQPEAFVTGLIRPIDVTVAPDGSLVVADYVYGHVWRVTYEG